MKYAEEIIKKIENRGTIDTDGYLIDDGWEDYIRRKKIKKREPKQKVRKNKLNIEDLYQITFGEDESYSCFIDAKDICYYAKPRNYAEHINLKEGDKDDYRRCDNET